jgi:NTE family protein
LSLAVEAIPGAVETLGKIRNLAEGKQESFGRFFVRFDGAHDNGLALHLCNVVFQGGGVLGLAHVGFLAGLEAAGIRCAGLSGTSAGAIVATTIACVRRADVARSTFEELFGILATMPMASFVDGRRSIRNLINHFLGPGGMPPVSLWPAMWTALRQLLDKRGLNPGREFESWLETTFSDRGVTSNLVLQADLAQVRTVLEAQGADFIKPRKISDGHFIDDPDAARALSMLRVVATGLPSGLKITFPEDLAFLDSKYSEASPAIFVRASMAIPAFFEPKLLEVDADRWREDVENRLRGLVAPNQITDVSNARHLYLVDGGLLSNVPVDAFELMTRERGGVEKFPTIVATLVGWKRPEPEATWRSPRRVAADVMRLAQAVRLQRDRDAWRRVLQTRNEAVQVVEIDSSEHNWLNFAMDDTEKGQLFVKGLNRAGQFLLNV